MFISVLDDIYFRVKKFPECFLSQEFFVAVQKAVRGRLSCAACITLDFCSCPKDANRRGNNKFSVYSSDAKES